MFAQLTYGASTPIAHVLADIATALTGGAIGGMSASLNAASSSIDNGPGGAASWTFVADSSSITADSNALSSGITSYGAKVFKQAASTSFGSQEKFIKIGFGSATTAPNSGFLVGYLGKGGTATLTGAAKFSTTGTWQCLNFAGTIASNAFTQPMRVQIYSSPSATMIQMAQGDLFSYLPVFCVFDFARNSPDLELAGNLSTVMCNGNVGSSLGSTRNSCAYMAETTVKGKVFGNGTGAPTTNRTLVHIGTPEIANVIPHLLTTGFKYEGFNKIGTKYDLLNVGVTKFFFYNGDTMAQVWYTTNICSTQIPYSSITDVTGVYACHEEAFGNNGNFYQTPLGTMCKFGIFMVEV
jgi:hypothetical protein